MKITLAKPDNAPNFCYLIVAEDGRDKLIQTDWDYPGIASDFGWSVASVRAGWREEIDEPTKSICQHDGTDGTIDCPECGMTASEFISDAAAYLDKHIGDTVDDPGYFE